MNLLSKLGWVISPSRQLIDLLKTEDKVSRGQLLTRWNSGLFCFEIFLCLLLAVLSYFEFTIESLSFTKYLLVYYAISRCCEISYAFYVDAFSELSNEERKTNLSKVDKIKMAMKSYLGLMINFSFIFYLLPIPSMFNCDFGNFLNALYFSGVTITTLGYGDISPVHWLSKMLVVSEVLAGFLLIAVAVATYIGLED